jgi:hypothetical protein
VRQLTAANVLPRLTLPRLNAWTRRPWRAESVIIALAVLLLALMIRLPFFLESDFPLNDGGMFFVMARDVAAAHYALPFATTYNGDTIPFAYPPLPFYLTSLLVETLRVPAIAVVRYLPLVANLLTLLAFVGLARALARSRYTVLFAAAALVVIPRSYEWLVMGGGLTRSLGLLFAVTALALAVPLYQRPTAARLLAAGLLVGLTVLSHLEMGLFVGYSYGLFFLAYGRSRRGVGVSAGLALVALVVTAPWWLTVIRYHGLEPFLAATTTAGWSTGQQITTALGDFLFPPERFLTLLGGLGLVGLAACLLRGAWLLPVWLPLVFALTPRSAQTEATIPLALLIGIGAGEVLLPGLASVMGHRALSLPRLLPRAPFRLATRPDGRRLALTACSLVLFGYAVLPYWLPASFGAYALEALPDGERDSMAWIAANTPTDSVFLVLSPKNSWEADYVLEWFPALAGRKSVLTPQGAEWLPAWAHARRVCLYNAFHRQALGSLPRMETWLDRMEVPYTHVYVSKLVRGPVDLDNLRSALVASPHYQVLRDDPAALVLARTDAAPPSPAQWSEPPMAPDCQNLFDQPQRVQTEFNNLYGADAPAIWADQHSRELTRRRPW